jgi:hypothetical protein
MTNLLLFQEPGLNSITYKSNKTGRIYLCKKLPALSFHNAYPGTELKYLSDPSTDDDIWYMERPGFGPVCHLSYCYSMNCIMGIGTHKGYSKEGLATFLIEKALNLYYPEVAISSFTKQGQLYIKNKVIQLAKTTKTKVTEYKSLENEFVTYS